MTKTRTSLFTLFGIAATVALSGCAHYYVGTSLPEKYRDVYVSNVRNESGQPMVEQEVARALFSEIRREGTLRIVSDESAASTRLDVKVVGYEQAPVRYNRDNTNLPDEYRMVLRANVMFTDLRATDPDKAVILEQVIEGEETFLRGTDTISARQRCLPEAGKDLAKKIVNECVNVW